MDEFHEDAVRIQLRLCRGDRALDFATKRREMLLEDALRLVLWKHALEIAAAIEALIRCAAKFGHVGVVDPAEPDVLGGLQERWQQADGIENLERAGLDRCGTRFAMRLRVAFDQTDAQAVADKLSGGEQPRRAGTND